MIILTPEAIQHARAHFYHLSCECIRDAMAGRTRVNDIDGYIRDEIQSIIDTLQGNNDHTFTFRQIAAYYQTGVCHPLLG